MNPSPTQSSETVAPNPRFPFIAGAESIKGSNYREDEINTIRMWLKRQPHLPPISDEFIALFLYSNYGSIEKTKSTIDSYFMARAAAPEFFSNRNGMSPEVQMAYKTVHMASLRQTTPEGYRVLVCRLADFEPSHLHFNEVAKAFFLFADICISEDGIIPGYVVIFDLKGVVLGHLTRVILPSLKKFMVYIQDAHPVRLKSIHAINCVSFMDRILALVKPLMKSEMIDMLQLHTKGLDGIFKDVPKDILPEDYGGKDKPTPELHADYQRLMETKYLDWFKEEEHLRANEELRVGSKGNAQNELFGMEGSFRKLAID